MVKQRRITLVQAAIQCELSYRQILRIYERYKAEGDAGLIHGNRGRVSSRKNPHQETIINRYIERYEGFGPTLASEYLEREGFSVNHDTLRKWLIKNCLWKKQRKRSPYRRKRERKAQFGELIQIDGSIHDWLGAGKHDCLLNMVDDATSMSLSILASGETTRVVMECLGD
jgi:transposase